MRVMPTPGGNELAAAQPVSRNVPNLNDLVVRF